MKYKCIKSYPGWKEGETISEISVINLLTPKDYPEYWQPIEEEKDYSEFIKKGYLNGYHGIQGKKGYLSYSNGIHYNIGEITTTVGIIIPTTCFISELKVGDYVYIEDGEMKQEQFKIYIGKCATGNYDFQYISYLDGVERILYEWHGQDKQVIKFI